MFWKKIPPLTHPEIISPFFQTITENNFLDLM